LPTVSVSDFESRRGARANGNEITDIIEGAVNTVPGIEEMRSNSSQGRSNVTLTFNLEKDPDQAYQEIQQKLSGVVNRLPETADPPVVRKSDPDSQPVLIYAISAPRNGRRADRFGSKSNSGANRKCRRRRRSADFRRTPARNKNLR
jgi:HAE1 family hydrophobic/amphiphilic exporter-1